MICGMPLVYGEEEELSCYYCGRSMLTAARCEGGHFVCDQCHTADHLEFIKSICAHTTETDPIALFVAVRESHLFPIHGPEHHALVPAAFLTAYRNKHGGLKRSRVDAAIERGASLPGGTCAYWGGCAAALGAGIAYSVILEATPLSCEPRSTVQALVSKVLARIAQYAAPRCCQRESYLALLTACELSHKYLPHALPASAPPPCGQTKLNRECLARDCPFHPATEG